MLRLCTPASLKPSTIASSTGGDGTAGAVEYSTQPLRTIRPSSPLDLLDFRDLIQYRDLLATLAWRDIKVRYRQTYLGAFWVLLQPILGASVFFIVFHNIGLLPGPQGVPYFVFSMSSLIAWNFFTSILNKASNSLVNNSQLISKVYFPRLLLPLSSVLSSTVDLIISILVLTAIMAFSGMTFYYYLAFLPLWLMSLAMLASGLSFLIGSLMVSYRDVQHILPVALQMMLYASPVGYTLDQALTRAPSDLHFVFRLNPLSGLLEGFRCSLLGLAAPDAATIAFSITVSAIVFLTGLATFKRMERRFADVI